MKEKKECCFGGLPNTKFLAQGHTNFMAYVYWFGELDGL